MKEALMKSENSRKQLRTPQHQPGQPGQRRRDSGEADGLGTAAKRNQRGISTKKHRSWRDELGHSGFIILGVLS
jgi:hypothetical protein